MYFFLLGEDLIQTLWITRVQLVHVSIFFYFHLMLIHLMLIHVLIQIDFARGGVAEFWII